MKKNRILIYCIIFLLFTISIQSSLARIDLTDTGTGLTSHTTNNFITNSSLWNYTGAPDHFVYLNESLGGRVGIGTDSPSYPLEIYSDLANVYFLVWAEAADASAGCFFYRQSKQGDAVMKYGTLDYQTWDVGTLGDGTDNFHIYNFLTSNYLFNCSQDDEVLINGELNYDRYTRRKFFYKVNTKRKNRTLPKPI